MLNSLFAGVSGIKNEQTHLDVISNNIANSNTIGYKSGRITFADTLSLTISSARQAIGNFSGRNAMQIGSGASIASIDTNFNQGSLDSTDMITDIGLSGRGFFVVNNGNQNFYTRAGAFQLDADGFLTTGDGSAYLMGKLASSSGELSTSTGSTLEKIQLPYGQKEAAKATSYINFFCNLNSNANKTEEWIAGQNWKQDGNPATTDTDLNDLDSMTVREGDSLAIAGTDHDGTAIENSFVYGTDGTTVGDLVNFINQQYTGATAYLDEYGKLRLKANEAGESSLSLNIEGMESEPTKVLTSGSFNSWAESAATGDSSLNQLLQTGTGYVNGDTINITLNGATRTFTYGSAGNGTTLNDLAAYINANSFGGQSFTASVDANGNLSVLNSSNTAATYTLEDGLTNTGSGVGGQTAFTIAVADAAITDATTTLDQLYNFSAGAFTINGSTHTGSSIGPITINLDETNTINDIVTALNNAYNGEATVTFADGALVVTDANGGTSNLDLSITDAGGTGLATNFASSITGGQPAQVLTGQTLYTSTQTVADASTAINDLLQTDTDYASGDYLYITINNQQRRFEYGADADGLTLGDIVSFINGSDWNNNPFTASINANGQLVVNANNGDPANYTLQDDSANAGSGLGGNTTFTTMVADSAADSTDVTLGSLYRFEPGDFTISGVTHNGTVIDPQTISLTADNTIADLLSQIETAFGGKVTATLENGNIVLTDNESGNSGLSFTLADDTGSGLARSFDVTTAGYTLPASNLDIAPFTRLTSGVTGSHATSIDVYDSQGAAHSVEILYTQSPTQPNQWNWEVMVDDGTIVPIEGNTGTISFNTDGTLAGMTYDSGSALRFDVAGANQMTVDLNMGTVGTMDGSTQSAATSTNLAVEQDGHTLGVLSEFDIDNAGVVTGIFTNGVRRILAQIALANFTNENGLTRAGGSLFNESVASGAAQIGYAGQANDTKMQSGYVENSNVDMTEEFSRLILAQRALQANAKTISSSDEVLQTLINQLKR